MVVDMVMEAIVAEENSIFAFYVLIGGNYDVNE